MFRPQPQIHAPDTEFVSSCTADGNDCAPIPIGVNIRDNAEIRPRYLETLCNITNGTGNETKIVTAIDAIDQLIRPVLAEEVPVLWEPLELDPLDAAIPGTYAAEVERMRTWVPARIEAVRQMIRDEGVECTAGCTDGASVPFEAFGVVTERVCSGGTWSACEGAPMANPGVPGSDGDAGVADAAVGAGDAGIDDAGAVSDGAPGMGVGVPGMMDAGVSGDAEPAPAGSCSCRLPGARTDSSWLALLAFAPALRRVLGRSRGVSESRRTSG
jgi:hypothetical protein